MRTLSNGTRGEEISARKCGPEKEVNFLVAGKPKT